MLEKMRELRKQTGMSMKQLGEKVGLAEVTISTYETGRSEPSLSVLCAIADELDCSLDMLVRGKEKDLPKGRSREDLLKRLDGYSLAELKEILAYANYLQFRKEREQAEGQGSKDSQ